MDQTDYYALCVIDPELAEQVKQIALDEDKHFRDILRSAIHQRRFRKNSPLKKFWEKLTPEERSARGSLASQKRWVAQQREEASATKSSPGPLKTAPKPGT